MRVSLQSVRVCLFHNALTRNAARQPSTPSFNSYGKFGPDSDSGNLYVGLECLLRLFMIARPKSGRNSFTTPNPILLAMEMPKLTAPSPAECWLGGCHERDRKAPAATPPSCEIERCRLPSSCRARRPLAMAYPVRGQNPFLPELK